MKVGGWGDSKGAFIGLAWELFMKILNKGRDRFVIWGMLNDGDGGPLKYKFLITVKWWGTLIIDMILQYPHF